MNDESQNVSMKSRGRAAEAISKVGFMDGAADGQKNTFQLSFDTGFSQGFTFGLKLGTGDAKHKFNNTEIPNEILLRDTRKINCQICMNSATAQDNVGHLLNLQKESNDQYLQKCILGKKK